MNKDKLRQIFEKEFSRDLIEDAMYSMIFIYLLEMYDKYKPQSGYTSYRSINQDVNCINDSYDIDIDKNKIDFRLLKMMADNYNYIIYDDDYKYRLTSGGRIYVYKYLQNKMNIKCNEYYTLIQNFNKHEIKDKYDE